MSSQSKKRVAIVQSNYIPWKGYFDLIGMVDEFILYDDAQYTRRDWRNRNKIKTPGGLTWLSVPVETKGRFDAAIKDIRLVKDDWPRTHWESIRHAYRKTDFFDETAAWLEPLYRKTADLDRLSEVNYLFITEIAQRLGLKTTVTWSMDYCQVEGKSEKLLAICRQAGASVYLSGPAAKDYLDESIFADSGIAVEWMDYSGYPEYKQLYPPFEHGVSVVDLLMNTGHDAPKFMKIGNKYNE